MAHLTAAADRIDYWIRRHAIQFYRESHPTRNRSKFNSARDRLAGLSAIGQCLKDQYDALAPPISPDLAALVKRLETQR
jgi:hypothetical protein